MRRPRVSSLIDKNGNTESLLVNIANKIYHDAVWKSEKKFNEQSLNRKQLAILVCINEHANSSPTDIAKQLNLSKSQMTALLEPLVSNAYISRCCDVKDRRRILLNLLPRGNEIVITSRPVFSSLLLSLLSSLNADEKEALVTFLQNFPDGSESDDSGTGS